MAAALDAAPGPPAESRGAITTTVRAELPGSVRITFRMSTSLPSSCPVKFCSETSPPSTCPKRCATKSPTRASPSLPGVRSGAMSTTWCASRVAA